MNHTIEREADIQKVCKAIVTMPIKDTGDHGTGGECPFCYKDFYWDAVDVSVIQHEPDCIYLIAKDLTTGIDSNEFREVGV